MHKEHIIQLWLAYLPSLAVACLLCLIVFRFEPVRVDRTVGQADGRSVSVGRRLERDLHVLGRRSVDSLRYDTIRDAILTCARKPTWISLIYRTQPTTKKCKNRKTKSTKQICSEITVNSPGNPCSEYLRRRNEGLFAVHCVPSCIAILAS